MNIRPKDSLSHEPTLLCAAFFLFYSRAILKSSRFLLASHSEKLAMSIRAPFLCAQRFSIREPFWKARDFYSRAFLCAQCYPINKPFWKARYLFAIREPFWKACDLYSRAFPWAHRLLFARLSLCRAAFPICKPFWKARNLYSRAILKSAASCFFFGFAKWNISIVVPYISLPFCMGESDISFKKTFCLMNIHPQDFLSHEPTLWFRRH